MVSDRDGRGECSRVGGRITAAFRREATQPNSSGAEAGGRESGRIHRERNATDRFGVRCGDLPKIGGAAVGIVEDIDRHPDVAIVAVGRGGQIEGELVKHVAGLSSG